MNHSVHIFTRRELYELVWSKPMQKIAGELGISDRGLAKICIRHRVPSPPRGYWAKLASGQKVKRALYRDVDDPTLNRVQISASLATLPEETRKILQKAKVDRAERRKAVRADPVVLARPSEQLHRTVTPTAAKLRKAKPSQYGCVSATGEGMCGVIVHVESVTRVIGFLHDLAVALEAAGLQLQPDGARMKIAVGLDDVTFTLTERTKREKHVPSQEEQALYERQQAKRQSAADRKNWDLYTSLPYQKPWPEYDTVYAGQLVFQIEGWARGLRKTWADGKTQSIESMFEDILAGLKIVLAHEKAERERREEDARQWAELARRRELAKKRDEREEQRVSFLRELVRVQREAADIKSWLGSLPECTRADSSAELERMLVWANERLKNLEARTCLRAAVAQLEVKSLFPEMDELHDPLGNPPEPKYRW